MSNTVLQVFLKVLEVTEEIKAFRVMVHEFIEMHKIDQHIQALMDKSVQLAQEQYKLQETVQKLSSVLQQVKMAEIVEKLISLPTMLSSSLKHCLLINS